MKQATALAMDLFSVYSEMSDDDQAGALAILRTIDPLVHDALVQLLVTDALTHELDAPPWHGRPSSARAAVGLPDLPHDSTDTTRG
ncbi:hypothetical protein [Pseudoxanthomonas japonensis]|uniref:Uncharacterized protein n=1 Tax=Pseudoxanthomonas japonensis TaxID=69284 RepID=A0ABQ6ZHT7_9GAMM|nr:hypothetical protein [Pseudoxanthomonas japonensis]KAF1725471.1 hypothetical protein CSC78_08370 [Pseudoxanthomonas japonensis]